MRSKIEQMNFMDFDILEFFFFFFFVFSFFFFIFFFFFFFCLLFGLLIFFFFFWGRLQKRIQQRTSSSRCPLSPLFPLFFFVCKLVLSQPKKKKFIFHCRNF